MLWWNTCLLLNGACIIGGPFGAMGTLENAKRVVCGDLRNRTKVAPLLLINKAPQNQAQAVAHTLRRLLLQHQEQRVGLRNKVNFSSNQKRRQLTIDKFPVCFATTLVPQFGQSCLPICCDRMNAG